MPRPKLLLVHHFSLSSVTGVTVMLTELLKLVPSIRNDIDVSYLHYEDVNTPHEIDAALEAAGLDDGWVLGVNLQIEVQWELSLALARWCARRSVPLYNYVQDYWPHHLENLNVLTKDCGVRLVGSSQFIIDSLADDGFKAEFLPMGAQIPAEVLPRDTSLAIVVASVGRLIRRKRFPDIVRAFCAAGLDKTSELQLTLIRSHVFPTDEDNRQLEMIKREITTPGVRSNSIQLRMTPVVPFDYSHATVYVSASDYEGFSMPPYEAAYSGCPPILSDIPPHRMMARAVFQDMAEDFLYPVTNTEVLAERLRDEITTQRRRRYISENQTRIREIIATNYSLKTTANALVQLCTRPDQFSQSTQGDTSTTPGPQVIASYSGDTA
jgi:glycosyltransferase involved in cell wall biosynthesis